ncbi:MAG: single-stranded DNA-binding protein [Clostridium sp.]|nr:single-stranded DNA-binding protein [Clostridium sp.]MCM1444180.1 single-stranded DNA-binding protein [Candidatus Amulumruptor caecigallinarius]
MLNQIVLVGRVVSDLEINETENERKFTSLKLAVPRSFKNENGEYETDFIPCVLWNTIAVNTCEYCKKGDLVGIKGRMQNKENRLEVIAEKVTFLSSKGAV